MVHSLRFPDTLVSSSPKVFLSFFILIPKQRCDHGWKKASPWRKGNAPSMAMFRMRQGLYHRQHFLQALR